MDDFKVYGVPAELSGQAVNVWPYINRALEHGAMETLEYLAKCVERGGAQLWAVFRGSELCAGMVTEIQDRPRGRVCVITAAGGDDITAEGCAYCIEQITPWANRKAVDGLKSTAGVAGGGISDGVTPSTPHSGG